MDEKTSLPQRIAGAGAALLLTLFLAVVAASPAHAFCPIDQDCGPQPVDYTSTLTIAPPANGQVTVTGPDGTQTICSTAQPDPCTISNTRTVLTGRRPTTGWPSYTLHWSGSHATWDGWSGACSGLGDCTVANDQDSKTVAAATHVVPTTVTVHVPDPTYRDSAITASATGDLGPFTFEWAYCEGNVLFPTCTDHPATQTGSWSQFLIGTLPDGAWQYRLYVTDALGTKTLAQQVTFTLQGLGLRVSDLPAVTRAPALTFSADDPDVTGFECTATPEGRPSPPSQQCDTAYAPQLTDGTWDLSVLAHGAGGVTQTITRTTTVDTTPPTVSFGTGPGEHATIGTGTARLAFTSTDAHPGTTSCTVDGTPVSPCASPIAMTGLVNGAHTVVITSADAVGNAATTHRDFSVRLPSRLTAADVATTYAHAAGLVARVTPAAAAGKVAFVSAGRTLCTAAVVSGVARCAAPASLPAGRRSVTARYTGAYAPSSASFALTVARAATHVSAHAARATVHRSQRETIIAGRVQPGTVTVLRAGHPLCRAAVARGTARCGFIARMSPGRYALTVRYGGNANYLASKTTVTVRVIR